MKPAALWSVLILASMLLSACGASQPTGLAQNQAATLPPAFTTTPILAVTSTPPAPRRTGITRQYPS